MKYKNIFNLSNELAKTITNIINKQEDSDYSCGTLDITIPEHRGLVFVSHFDQNQNWGGPSLSGAEIKHLNEKYGRYEEGIIPEKSFSYLIIMRNDLFDTLQNFTFHNKEDIEETLSRISEVYKEYDGVFDCKIMLDRFPYLQSFFATLDDWREKTGRVILDNDILKQGSLAVLKNTQKTSLSEDEKIF